jgi:ribonuclease BN (tRNA processing enzyme)
VAYRIENPAGIAVVLTGDTEPCDDLVELARAADVLISDSSLSGTEVLGGHMSAAQAGALAREAGVRTLILSHLAPEKPAADLVAEARAAFPGQVVAAYDLLSMVL